MGTSSARSDPAVLGATANPTPVARLRPPTVTEVPIGVTLAGADCPAIGDRSGLGGCLSEATVMGVRSEPSNAASELAHRNVTLLNDRDFMRRDGLSLCTEDFVRYDRRRMTAQPPADRQGWLDAMFMFAELAGGQWPTFQLTETVAVRGRRLAANRWTVGVGEVGEVEFIVVSRANEAVDKNEVIYFFDPEDIDEALTELDRLHSEVERGEQG